MKSQGRAEPWHESGAATQNYGELGRVLLRERVSVNLFAFRGPQVAGMEKVRKERRSAQGALVERHQDRARPSGNSRQ